MPGEQFTDISVVVPVYNEQDSLESLYKEITASLSGKYTYEIIFIDDGSTDKSFDVLDTIRQNDSNVRVIRFRTNFGQTAAMSAGFEHCRGEVIVPLDADGQNDPADIPMLLNKLDEGYDIVSGWRKDRRDTLTRTIPSKMANWLIAKITGVKLHDFGCSLKAYRKRSLQEIRLYGEMHRFIPALASWSGEKVTEMEVNHRPRTHGVAKYGLNRTFKVLLDLFTVKFLSSYSTKPIHVFGGLGILSGLGAIITGIVVVFQKLAIDFPINRNPLLILIGILVTTSVQFILMGLMAEMLVRTYHESQGRSTYVIDKIYQSSGTSDEIENAL